MIWGRGRKIQGTSKRLFQGFVKLGEKVAFCLPTAGRRTQFVHPKFTQSGKGLLVQPCCEVDFQPVHTSSLSARSTCVMRLMKLGGKMGPLPSLLAVNLFPVNFSAASKKLPIDMSSATLLHGRIPKIVNFKSIALIFQNPVFDTACVIQTQFVI